VGSAHRTQNGRSPARREHEADAQQAMGIAQSGDMQFALYSSNVICLDEDRDKLHESARLIMKTIQNIGFSCRLEDVNAIEAWRGSLPGDGYSNVRRVPLHTLNLADMLPITSVWAGLRENPSPLMPKNSPPLLYAATTGATPFRFHLHVRIWDTPWWWARPVPVNHIARPHRGAVVPVSECPGLLLRQRLQLMDVDSRVGGEFYDLAGSSPIWHSAPYAK